MNDMTVQPPVPSVMTPRDIVQELDLIFSPLQLPAIGGHGAELRIDNAQLISSL